MSNPSGDKLCPICDSPLQPGSKKCSFCGTDLSIFDIDIEASNKPEPVATQPRVSMSSKVDEVFSRPAVQPSPPPLQAAPKSQLPIREAPKPEPIAAHVVSAPPSVPEKVKESPKPLETRLVPPAAKPEEFFECPECKTNVPLKASICPKCGVMFAEEGTEMFQCPACNTLVSVDAKSCPGCGAVFIEPDEALPTGVTGVPAAPEPSRPSAPVVKDIEPPVQEVKAARPTEAKPKAEPEKEKRGWFKWGKKEEPKLEQAPAQKPFKETVEQAKPEIRQQREPVREIQPKPAVRTTPPPSISVPSAYAPPTAASQDKGSTLARMVAEMKPLFTLANDKDIDVAEAKQLIDDAVVAGRDRQVDKAIELVQKSKIVLMGKVDANLAQLIGRLNDEIRVARDFGGDISRPTTYIQEVTRARTSGEIEAAFVYADKVRKELLPITGRYNESRSKLSDLKKLIQNCEAFVVDTKDARRILADATKSFEMKDFDKVDSLVREANDNLVKAIPARMSEEMKRAKEDLVEAKSKNVNITPMLTVLKSAMGLMKAGDYPQAVKEMRDFREMMKKAM